MKAGTSGVPGLMKKKDLLKIINVNERVEEEEAATRRDILLFFGQGNFIFKEKPMNSQGILKRDVW